MRTSRSREVKYTPDAAEQVEEAVHWWRSHRDKAPDPLEEELSRGLKLVSEQHYAGFHLPDARFKGVRRILLKRVRYHVYYRLNAEQDVVEVLALWHASRKHRPQGLGAL